ncbi:MAG: nucleotidyltransferase domain-containing protein [Halobacteriota archaeon]
MRGKITGCLPSRQQELLLKAALLQGNVAIDAWTQWKAQTDLDHIDYDSIRLLPVLYKNLSALGVDDPLLNRYKGLHKRAWYMNQVLLHRMASLIRSLEDAGIRTMILKGAPLNLLYYRDYGLRPMGDIDLLVPFDQAAKASSLLLEWGLKPEFPSRISRMEPEFYFSSQSETSFVDDSGTVVDLHWHILYELNFAQADDTFWDAAVPINADDGLTTLTLCPADLLLHTIVHGIRWNPEPMLRWVADASVIINSGKEIDWQRLITLATRYHLVLYVRNGLLYLNKVLDIPIPASCLEQIQRIKCSPFERMEYYLLNLPFGHPILHLRTLCLYSRREGDSPVIRRLVGLPAYLQALWGLEHLWQVPFCGIKRFFKIWQHQ